MTGWELFTSTWDWEPTVVAGSGLLLAGYLALQRVGGETTSEARRLLTCGAAPGHVA